MILLNDQLLPSAHLPLPNRGLAFGDGFFETLVLADGRLRYAAGHLARMQQAAAALYLTLPPPLASAEALTATLARLAAALGWPAARLRLQIWRGGGGRYTPPTSAAEWLATAEPFVPNDEVVNQLDVARDTHTALLPLSFCKGPLAWLYVRAAHERQQRGLDDILLLDAAGHVAEAGASAVFWIKNGVLFTPSLASGCVAGVRRAHLLQVARAQGRPCREGLYPVAELAAAEAVFTANVAGIRAVAQLGTVAFDTAHPLLQALRDWEAI